MLKLILRNLQDQNELWPYEDEPLEFGLTLPRHLFVVGCGGCQKAGRALIDRESNELLRHTWVDTCVNEEWDSHLSSFYEGVKSLVCNAK